MIASSNNLLWDSLFGVLAWILVGPFLIPTILLLAVVCSLVHILAFIFRPDLLPVSWKDAGMAFAPSHDIPVGQIWKIRGDMSVDSFRQHFELVFLTNEDDQRKYENLYCYFENFLGYAFKKKVDKLDLNYHIQELKLGNGQTLESFVSNWMFTPEEAADISKEKKPDWMIKIIHHPKDSGTTVLFKLHHGFCDGYTNVHLVEKLSGVAAPYMFKDPFPTLSKKLQCLLQWPYISIRMISHASHTYQTKTIQSQINQPDEETRPEEMLTSFSSLDINVVKEIRRMTKTKFVSVLMSVYVGALKRLMMDLSEDPCKSIEDVEDIYVGHSMGWPAHPMMTKGYPMGNHSTVTILRGSLKTSNPLKRLLDLDTNFHEMKQIGVPEMFYYFMMPMGKLQPSFITRFVMESRINLASMEIAFTNLPCSPKPHTLLGHPVDNLYLPVFGKSLMPKAKLVTMPVSHSGKLDISTFASTALVQNQTIFDKLTNVYIPEELEMLKTSCIVREEWSY